MNKNKQIIENCPNFYKIINFDYFEEDYFTANLIKIYRDFVFSIDPSSEEEITKVKSGIIKENCPVVMSKQTGEAESVIKKVCKQNNSELIIPTEQDFENVEIDGLTTKVTFARGSLLKASVFFKVISIGSSLILMLVSPLIVPSFFTVNSIGSASL